MQITKRTFMGLGIGAAALASGHGLGGIPRAEAANLAADFETQEVTPDIVPQEVQDLLAAPDDLQFDGKKALPFQLRLLKRSFFGDDVYYAIEVYDPNADVAEPVFVKNMKDRGPDVLESIAAWPEELELYDTEVVDTASDFDLKWYALNETGLSVIPRPAEQPGQPDLNELSKTLDALVKETAKVKVDSMSSKTAPGTNKGRLACAWAVNKLIHGKLGAPIGGSLSTTNMGKVLASRHGRVKTATPGCVVISPTVGKNVGHVGIVGENELIYSNSSSQGQWKQNFTINKWQNYYVGKGLAMYFYRLDNLYFPNV
jgi:hypothetical protein